MEKIMTIKKIFKPNELVSKQVLTTTAIFQAVVVLLLWFIYPSPIIPKPHEIVFAFGDLFANKGLLQGIVSSLLLNVEAVLLSTVISVGIAYLTVIPFFKPIAGALSKGRFLGLIGLSFLFILTIKDTHTIKLAMLTFGMSVFFITGMVDVVSSIPSDQFDYARTLRMKEGRIIWEVVVLGTIDKAIELMRQNAAIGWMMLTMVEGMFRSEGGIGVLLLNEDKHLQLDKVLAIQTCIFTIGIVQDWAAGAVKAVFCPYVDLADKRGK
jgi:NitT/TauT family transport system permease protein